MPPRFVRSVALACAAAAAPVSVFAQASPARDAVTPQLDFSGVLFGSYGYRLDSASRAQFGGREPNQFTLERAYLNIRMPAGENAQIRITPDVYLNTNNATNSFYQGWDVRLKYGYVQYTGLRNRFGPGSSLTSRVGIMQTVVIDYIESFWPRYLVSAPEERNGFFSSADAGAGALITLGDKWGEVYATVTNGPGYTQFDRDRFKDVAARASITPFARNDRLNPILKTFSITPWFYRGWIGSNFAAGGAGQVGLGTNGAITDGLQRDRLGLFVGVKERRLTAGFDISQRMDEGETGLNTIDSPRVVVDSTGRLFSSFMIGRPFEWFNPAKHSNFSVLGRFDHFTPNTHPSSINYADAVPYYNYWLVGAQYDANQRLTFALDWQVQSPNDFPAPVSTNVRPTPRQSTVFLHWQATF